MRLSRRRRRLYRLDWGYVEAISDASERGLKVRRGDTLGEAAYQLQQGGRKRKGRARRVTPSSRRTVGCLGFREGVKEGGSESNGTMAMTTMDDVSSAVPGCATIVTVFG